MRHVQPCPECEGAGRRYYLLTIPPPFWALSQKPEKHLVLGHCVDCNGTGYIGPINAHGIMGWKEK